MNEKIVIVVPCYNEEERLQPEAFLEALSVDSGLNWLFVNDGSKDQTAQLIDSMATRFPDRVTTVHLEKNSGKGEAVRQGLIAARATQAEIVGYYDADQATPLSEIFRLLTILRSQKHQVLLGARVFLLGRKLHRQRWRFWLGRCFALVASQMLRLEVYDTQCGMKLIRNFPQLGQCLEAPFVSKWLFDVELLQRFMLLGGLSSEDFFEEPLLRWSEISGSKVKARAFAVALIDLFKIKMKSKSL